MSDQVIGQFEVHPSVVFKLGADLITDDVQAIAELVKNAYDADAKTVVVRIHTTASPPERPDDVGYVDIVDTGVGMTVEDIKRGWLTIAASPKRDFKAAGHQTALRRTPLGDKGLGRLGTQRLGNRVTIVTTPAGTGRTNRFSFDWRDFEKFDALSKVKIDIVSAPSALKQGTRIVISDLHRTNQLEDEDRLQVELSKTISPYEGVKNFKLRAELNDKPIDLGEAAVQVRNGAVVRYRLDFDDEVLTIRGLIRIGLFRPNAKDEKPAFDRLVTADKGAALLQHLQATPGGKDNHLIRSPDKGWWGEISRSIRLDGSEVEPVVLIDGSIPSPGPFHAEVDGFNLSAGSIEQVGVFDSVGAGRIALKSFSGIRVYRDGFNVRVDDDWLKLGRGWTGGASYFGLRPGTTMGYVAISAAANQQLVETTDREGFQATEHYRNFLKLMSAFVAVTSEVQEFIGRGAAKFRKSADLHLDDEPDPAGLVLRLEDTLSRAQGWVEPLHDVRSSLVEHTQVAEQLVSRLSARADLAGDQLEMLESLNALSRHAARAADLVDELTTFIQGLAEQQRVGERLRFEMDTMTEQLSLAYDTISVGLTAEALSHEIANIAGRLASRAATIDRHIRTVAPDDRQLGRFVEEVRGSVAGLRRQLAHLAPSLRFVRERRETMLLSAVLSEVADYFGSRWHNKPLQVDVSVVEDFAVSMNRGKLLQVFDNLLLNSEYWLSEDIRLGLAEVGTVHVVADAPFVRVDDSGRGIEAQVQHSLFEPFITRKPQGEGRGLGLFIVRQLLDAEGCSISLTPERNDNDRPFVFEINFSGAIPS